jgi:hypothetical protein
MYQTTRRGPRVPFIAIAEIAHTDLVDNLVVGSLHLVFMAAT